MVYENNLKPITENKKPIETVSEIKDEYKVPTYEEFLKTYEADDNLSYDDLSGGSIGEVKGYGPGNSQSSFDDPSSPSIPRGIREQRRRRILPPPFFPPKHDLKPIDSETVGFVAETLAKGAAAAAVAVATGGAAPIIGGSIWIGGKLFQSSNNDFLQFLGSKIGDIGLGTFTGGLFSNSSVGEVVGDVNLKLVEWFYEAKGHTETAIAISKHAAHRDRGIDRESDCEICRL